MSREAVQDQVQRRILQDLANAPAWRRTYQANGLKTAVDRLIQSGLAEPVKPVGGRAKNMVAITDQGRAALAAF